MHHIWPSTNNYGQIFKQNFPENYSKSTKIVITACKFSNFFWGSMLADIPSVFFVSQSASNWFCRKNTLEKMWKLCPPTPFKISCYGTVRDINWCSRSILFLFYDLGLNYRCLFLSKSCSHAFAPDALFPCL